LIQQLLKIEFKMMLTKRITLNFGDETMQARAGA